MNILERIVEFILGLVLFLVGFFSLDFNPFNLSFIENLPKEIVPLWAACLLVLFGVLLIVFSARGKLLMDILDVESKLGPGAY